MKAAVANPKAKTDGERRHMAGCRLSARDCDKGNYGTTGSGSTRTHEAYHTKKTAHMIKHTKRSSHGLLTWMGQLTYGSLHERGSRTDEQRDRTKVQTGIIMACPPV
ncbi:hypothetical protein R1flu_022994 [Riccia fluitans]|uniref:Uncharacterized protein n=1 Tax=Riccia fluitans TaxID=41844 RepID=A0ABD1XQS5_9MARC